MPDRGLQQPERAHALMAVRPDDDVIVDGDAQRTPRLDHLARELDILPAGAGIAARVVMDLSASAEIGRLINMFKRAQVGVEPSIGVCNSPRFIEIPVRPGRSRKGPDLHADA